MNSPIFIIRKFSEPSLGNYLSAGRKKLKLSLEKVADQISVSEESLKSLEKNNFSQLPPEIYIRGIIRRYCRLVGLDATKALYLFEKNKLDPKKDDPLRSIIIHRWFGSILSYRNLVILVILFFVTTSIFYLLKVIYPMYATPQLTLINPNACPFRTSQEKIEVDGAVQPENKVWINSEEALVNREGNFRCPLFLKDGENTVKFQVVNKFGKIREGECVIIKD